MSNVRLPDVFIDAKTMIVDALEGSKKLSIKTYGALFSNLCDVMHFHIDEAEDEEGYANLDLSLTYRIRKMNLDNQFEEVEKTKILRVLSPSGDNQWTYRMINKIWEGDYPSTVAVDTETGEVYFFNIKINKIELVEFGQFDEKQFETFLLEVHDREPFRIKLDEFAMFEYIDGAEGINHLQKSVKVEFNCGMPIEVSNKRVWLDNPYSFSVVRG